jgi:hypothetical protein
MPRALNQLRFRIAEASTSWAAATESVRAASAEPGYNGPSIEEMEQVEGGIKQVHTRLRDWIWSATARKVGGLRPGDVEEIRRELGI